MVEVSCARTTYSAGAKDVVRAQVFVISREKIQKRGYETLFKYMTVNNARTTIGRSVLSAPKRWQVRGAQL